MAFVAIKSFTIGSIGTTASAAVDLRSGLSGVPEGINCIEVINPSDTYLHFATGPSDTVAATTSSEAVVSGGTKWRPFGPLEQYISVIAPTGTGKTLVVNVGHDSQLA